MTHEELREKVARAISPDSISPLNRELLLQQADAALAAVREALLDERDEAIKQRDIAGMALQHGSDAIQRVRAARAALAGAPSHE